MIKDLAKQLRAERRHGAPLPQAATLATADALPSDDPPPPPLGPLSPSLQSQLAALATTHPRLHQSLSQLDAAQLEAVLSTDAAALVRAPVGSGKTTVLVHKVLYLHYVLGVPLSAMALLTFTKRAAGELRSRIAEHTTAELTEADFWLTGTFHGVARALLTQALPIERLGYRRDFAILDEVAQDALLDTLIRRHRLRVGRRQTLRKRLRAHRAQPAASDDLSRLVELLAAEKLGQNALDFDDLIDHATTLLAELAASPAVPSGWQPPRYILVDEMQDCEPRELAFLRHLRGAETRFFAVGDPHQAIYGFRGSAPALFAAAEVELGCRSYTLPVNYRSTSTIVDGARALLGPQGQSGGTPRALRGRGSRITIRRHHDPLSEAIYLGERLARLHAEGVGWGELAVLYRLRAQGEPIRDALRSRAIPCSDPDAPAADAVNLLTLHAGKGLEFRYVFLSGINLGLLPLCRGFDTAADAEEQRLLFVGLSRARDGVEISYHTRPQELGAVGEPSPFLLRLPAALVDWQDALPVLPSPEPPPPAAAAAVPTTAPPPAPPPLPATPSSPWQPGQSVRHPRYGVGGVVAVSADTVDCDFGKLGRRSFPLALCPLTAAAVGT